MKNNVRPLYETQKDLNRESDVVQKIERWSGCVSQKLPITYHLDIALFRDGYLKAWGEVKCRTFEHNRFDTLLLSYQKVLNSRRLTKGGVPAYLFTQYTDGLFYVSFAEFNDFNCQWGGRKDRGDKMDMEVKAFLPTTRLTRICD